MSKKQLFHTDTTNNKPLVVTKANPCPNCGNTDWCYSILSFTVCDRDAEPAYGLLRTAKSDRDRFHQPNYALAQPKQSPIYLLSNCLSNCQKFNNVQGGIA